MAKEDPHFCLLFRYLVLVEYPNKDLFVLVADMTIIEHCTVVIHAFRIST